MADKIKLQRDCPGAYRTADSRFRVVKDPRVIGNMWGAFSEPWDVTDRGKDAGSFHTLADARRAIERILKKEKQ